MNNEKKKYAVVKFLSDSTYSEIPTAWLIDDKDNEQCWWPPRSSNSAACIANCNSPNYNTWNRYEVEIIKYCTSLESARKSAADANYQTTDEDTLGRGKRQRMLYNPYESEEMDHDNYQPRKYIKKKQGNTSNIPTPPSCPSNFQILNKEANVPQGAIFNATSEIDEENNFETAENEKENYPVLSTYNTKQHSDLNNISIIVDGYEQLTETIQDNNIKKILHQLLRMQAASNISLRNINEQLCKIKDAIKRRGRSPVETNDNLIAPFLPLETIEGIKEFESMLKTSDELVIQFKQFLLKIGGNHAKDSVQKCLKKLLTNECAMKCSWKGLRNNFKVSNLYFIKIMKQDITSRYITFTECEFDNTTSEWLRFASQRNKREAQAKEDD